MSISSNLKFKNGSLSFSTLYSKRFALAFVYMKFETKQNELLNMLLHKFIHEKVIVSGANMVNEIYSAQASPKGIIFSTTEKHIIGNIALIYQYLLKTKLSASEAKYVSSGNYNELHKEISKIDVRVIGKCPHFNKIFDNSDDKKKKHLIEIFDKAESKDDFPNIANDKLITFGEAVKLPSAGKREIFDLAMYLKDCDFIIENNEIKPLSVSSMCGIKERLAFVSTSQGMLKSWITQFGSVGSPASNDTDKKKFNEKCKLLLESVNMLASMFGDLHGVDYKFKDAEEIKSVNSESKKFIQEVVKIFK